MVERYCGTRFSLTHHSRIRNDHASRGELSERNVICFGFDYIRGIVHPYERKINSKSRCNRYLLMSLLGVFLSLFIFIPK
jgi:hypothetical protein